MSQFADHSPSASVSGSVMSADNVNNAIARSDTGKSAGVHMVEFRFQDHGSNGAGSCTIGVCLDSLDCTQDTDTAADPPAGPYNVSAWPLVNHGMTNPTSCQIELPNGQWGALLLDCDNHELRVRDANGWAQDAIPLPTSGTFHIFAQAYSNTSEPSTVEVNFGASAFDGEVPEGAERWDALEQETVLTYKMPDGASVTISGNVLTVKA